MLRINVFAYSVLKKTSLSIYASIEDSGYIIVEKTERM